VTSTLGQACDIAGPALRAALAERLQTFNRNHAGASVTVKRALVLTEPPSVNAHEVSDKGSINRRVVLDRRADLVERLYAPSPDAAVIVPG
jgi:feruloyl-CoA synthase